jgi:hypothetical protein
MTGEERPPPRGRSLALGALAARARDHAAAPGATAMAGGRDQPVDVVSAARQGPRASRPNCDAHLCPSVASRTGRSRKVPCDRGDGDQRNDFAMTQITVIVALMAVLGLYLR